MSLGGRANDDFVRRLEIGQVGGDPPLRHHQHAIGNGVHLLEVGRGEHHREALIGQFAHGAEHLFLGADVDAAGGFVQEKHPGFGHQALADDHLLLVAAGQGGDRRFRRRRLDAQRAEKGVDRLALGTVLHGKELRDLGETGKRQILADGEVLHQPVALPILRDKEQPGGNALGYRQLIDGPASDGDFATRIGPEAEQAFEQFRAAGTQQTVDADDLAGPEIDADVIDEITATDPRQLQVPDRKHGLAHLHLALLALGELRRAEHLADDPGNGRLALGRARLEMAVAQNREIVADADELLEAVRDVDDGDARLLQFGNDAEQHLDLGGGQRRRRLVHDQHAGVVGQRLGDLDDLLLADPEIVDQRIGVDVVFEAGEQLPGALALAGHVDMNTAHGHVAPEENVLGDREVGAEIELLEDDADALLRRIEHGGEPHFLAAHHDAAGGRLIDAGEDTHQRRLAGAVLADQHIDRPLVDVEIDILQGNGTGEDAGHLLGAKNDLRCVGPFQRAHSPPPAGPIRTGVSRILSVAELSEKVPE